MNHVSALKIQLERPLREFPTLKIKCDVQNIEDFKYDDFVLENYNPHPKIDMEMAVWIVPAFLIVTGGGVLLQINLYMLKYF